MKKTIYYSSFPYDLYVSGKRFDKVSADKVLLKALIKEAVPYINLKEVEVPTPNSYVVYSIPVQERPEYIEKIVEAWSNRYEHKGVFNNIEFINHLKSEYPLENE